MHSNVCEGEVWGWSMNKLLLVVASFVIGCSLANREGIEASCEELDDGTKNVCREGIITSCIGDEIQYRVCEDEKSCEAQWQTRGSYRCNQGDPFDTVPLKEVEPTESYCQKLWICNVTKVVYPPV